MGVQRPAVSLFAQKFFYCSKQYLRHILCPRHNIRHELLHSIMSNGDISAGNEKIDERSVSFRLNLLQKQLSQERTTKIA